MPDTVSRALTLLLCAVSSALLSAACMATPQPAEELPLELPASFLGTLPCADCPGIDWHLDLWPDGRYALSRSYRDRDGRDDELGRWRFGADDSTLLLYGNREAPLHLAVVNTRSLRLLDRMGGRIASSLPYELQSEGELRPAELQINIGGTQTVTTE